MPTESTLVHATEWQKKERLPTAANTEHLREGDRVLVGYREGKAVCVFMLSIKRRIRSPSLHYLALIGGEDAHEMVIKPEHVGAIHWMPSA